MNPFFNAVETGKSIGDGTVNDLLQWLEQYINILFPESGIEYWSHNREKAQGRLRPKDPLPAPGRMDGIGHVACYVRHGHSEGRIIEIQLSMPDNAFLSLGWIKSFGKEDECWLIARAIIAAMDGIIFYHEIPQIVDLLNKLPRQYKWSRETTLVEHVTISTTESSLQVSTASGQVLDNRDWSERGSIAKFSVEAYRKDWEVVLTNMKAKYSLESSRRLFADDLQGYLISDRGVPGISGFYVLPPGCNPRDDRQYVGYFGSAELALAGARAHRDGQAIIFH